MSGLIPFNRRNTGISSFHNMLDDFFNDAWMPGRNLLYDSFKLDVSENEDNYLIEAEMPGVKKEEIGLELNDGRLTISISRDESKEDKKSNYIHRERKYSSMQRSIYLADANEEGIKAKLEEGILKIDVPKVKGKKNSRQIDIQ